jgi:hypothetical protein
MQVEEQALVKCCDDDCAVFGTELELSECFICDKYTCIKHDCDCPVPDWVERGDWDCPEAKAWDMAESLTWDQIFRIKREHQQRMEA